MQVLSLHAVQKHILRQLTFLKWGRFSQLRPPKTESNLFNYHLRLLVKNGFIEKHPAKGYRLSPYGLRYVDHVSLEKFEPRWQPKVITVQVIQDKKGRFLVWPKYKQPFINSWSLLNGKVHYEDTSIESAALRELGYMEQDNAAILHYRGAAEIVARIEGEVVSHIIAHVFVTTLQKLPENPRFEWKTRAELNCEKCAPATAELITAALEPDPFNYRYFDVDW